MKKAIEILLLFLLLPIALCAQRVAENLPAPKDGTVQEMHESWSGVLRLWVYDGWQSGSGSLSAWLNKSIARFEKRHPGVYVQVTAVTEENMAKCLTGEFNPPDAIVFPPGLMTDVSHLAPIDNLADAGLNASLRTCGRMQGEAYAAPIAMGGYAWACNADEIRSLPSDWAETAFAMRASEDSEFQCTSAALIALCAGTQFEIVPEQAGSGMDLGLSSLQPTPEPALTEEHIFSRLSTDFARTDSAFSLFTAEEATVIPVTQYGIRRLQIRSESGKGPDWAVYSAGEAFTDQLALFAVVNWPREDAEARIALGKELLHHLLNEESQTTLTTIRALRVTEGDALYPSQSGMAQLEAAYSGRNILVPNAFDTEWRQEAQVVFSLFADGRISPEAAWSKLTEILTAPI